MRGKATLLTLTGHGFRITPAHAGKSEPKRHETGVCGDHPRACGEKPKVTPPHSPYLGSPPRMRGKGVLDFYSIGFGGITPAHAGKRRTTGGTEPSRRDHPRACGEKGVVKFFTAKAAGSPPRMRGKEVDNEELRNKLGITPAHAGKSPHPILKMEYVEDHPRACGEKRCPL